MPASTSYGHRQLRQLDLGGFHHSRDQDEELRLRALLSGADWPQSVGKSVAGSRAAEDLFNALSID
jgi:hypothetical protein